MNSFAFVNSLKVNQFKVKHSEIKPYAVCLGNISKYFAVNDVKKKKKKGLKS